MSPDARGTHEPGPKGDGKRMQDGTAKTELPVTGPPPPAPSPVAGLERDVEVMNDGLRRITFYSRSASAEERT